MPTLILYHGTSRVVLGEGPGSQDGDGALRGTEAAADQGGCKLSFSILPIAKAELG